MGRGQSGENSVFDFLYANHKRIAVLHSQLNNYGNLTRLVKHASAANEVAGEANLAITKMGAQKKIDESLESEYDAQWALPMAFLEELADLDLIQRNLLEATIGQIVLWTGSLVVRDLGMVKQALELPVWKREILTPPTDLSKAKQKEEKQNRERAMETISLFPGGTQAVISNPQATVWGILDPTSGVAPFSDLILQYGTNIQGEWSILGILEAKPDIGGLTEQMSAASNVASTNWVDEGLGALSNAFGQIGRAHV